MYRKVRQVHTTYRIPYLKLDLFSIDVYHPSTKLHPWKENDLEHLSTHTHTVMYEAMALHTSHFLLSTA